MFLLLWAICEGGDYSSCRSRYCAVVERNIAAILSNRTENTSCQQAFSSGRNIVLYHGVVRQWPRLFQGYVDHDSKCVYNSNLASEKHQ